MASSRVVEITLISCEDLKTPYFRKSIKKDALAMIKIPRSNDVRSTTVNKEGGAFPHWNEKFRVELPFNVSWFEVEIRCGMEQVIGTATVPVSDFVNSLVPEGYLNCLSYRLKEPGNKWNGIVNLSVIVIRSTVAGGRGKTADDCGFSGMAEGKEVYGRIGKNAEWGFSGTQMGFVVKDQVVIGIPVPREREK